MFAAYTGFLNHIIISKFYVHLRDFIYKETDKNVDKANSKIFEFNFANIPFSVPRRLLCTRILYPFNN